MSVRTVRTLARLHVKETILAPGFAMAMTLSALAGYLVVRGFVLSLDSQGFNATRFPLFGSFIATLEGMFGQIITARLFAQGPFLAGIFLAIVPILLYLAASSILTYHVELDAGAIELVLVGPVDHYSVILALLVKDMILFVASVIFLLAFFLLVAIANNLVLGPEFFLFLGTALLLGLVLFAWAQLCSVMTGSGIGSLSLFFVLTILFFIAHVGSYSIVTEELRTFFLTLSRVVQWIAPFYYTGIVMTSAETGSWIMAVTGGIAMIVLASGLLFSATFIGQRGGVVS